jgi:response regulator RpfG family c-di-GMP phosphodiesterase
MHPSLHIASDDRLSLVYRLSQTFNSTLELDRVLNTVIDEVIESLHAERGFVMLKDADGKLIFKVARGIDQRSIEHPDFEISRSVVEHVKNDGLPFLTVDAQKDRRFNMQQSIVALGLHSILCVPLKSKDKMIGIIYVDNPLHIGAFDKPDLEFLNSLASNAAVAIENASLFEGLELSKRQIEEAYDTTLEGWAKALEFRDQVTEGHTRRVTDTTVKLAKLVGINDDELHNIRRGSILHDIGKMAIPDRILLKPGPLTNDEYEIMKKHPLYAYEMLYPIEFLRPALDIPYCHHERWDGQGYPRQLKEIQIPLSARIFAIVDVWDALHSDRPYRQEWPYQRVIEYIREQSSTQFDPYIVETFTNFLSINSPDE